MKTHFYYYVVVYDGCTIKDMIIGDEQFAGCKLIDKDRFVVIARSYWEGVILRVNANKQDLENNIKNNPIDLSAILKTRFSSFPYTQAKSTDNDNGKPKVEKAEQKSPKPQTSKNETNAHINEKAKSSDQNKRDSENEKLEKTTRKRKQTTPKTNVGQNKIDCPARPKLRSTYKIETATKRKLDTSSEQLPSADGNIGKPGISKRNETNDNENKNAEVVVVDENSDDMSIHKRYKVYKRKASNPPSSPDKRIPEQQAQQESIPTGTECNGKQTTSNEMLQSSEQVPITTTNPEPEQQMEFPVTKIEATPGTNNISNSRMTMEQSNTVPQIDQEEFANSDFENEMYSDKQRITQLICEQEYNELLSKTKKLKKQCQQLHYLNGLLLKHIGKMHKSSGKILRQQVPSWSRYTSDITPRFTCLPGAARKIEIDSDEMISDDDDGFYQYVAENRDILRACNSQND